MTLLELVRRRLDRLARERKAVAELSRLDDRGLADIGLARTDIRAVARVAARDGAVDAFAFRERALTGRSAGKEARPRPRRGRAVALRHGYPTPL